jgi:acyl-CoA dehydrogenase
MMSSLSDSSFLNHRHPWREFRKSYISKPVFELFRKALPRMSRTEKEALQAGTVWWDGELFSGAPDWNKLIDIPMAKLTADEQSFLNGPVETLCSMLDDWEITHLEKDLPKAVWQFIKENRFFGLIIPKQYGGLEYSALAHSAMVMKVASKSVTAAVTVMVPNSLGPAKLILEYGTLQQKNYYLPRLARGLEIPAFALTSPDAGSDAGSMTDTGVVCYDEFEDKETLGIRLNWNKRYITLGPVCTLLGLAFKLYDPDHLLSSDPQPGITLALIPTSLPGINIGRRHYPLSQTFQNGPNSGKDVFIPVDWIIGGKNYAGKGWKMLMESLADGRSISLPALSTGSGKLASRVVGAYARIRKQFNRPIGEFGGVSEALTRIAGYTYIMDAARCLTISSLELGEKPSVASAVVKYHMTEKMRKVINDAMDVFGGAAICMGPRNIMGRVYQAVPISITVEGANILTRSMIIFGQGAIRCHPYVFREIKSINNKKNGLEQFDRAFSAHLIHIIKLFLKSFFAGVTAGKMLRYPNRANKEYIAFTRSYYQKLSRMSVGFALLSDICMISLGGKLKRMENISGRLADILSYLYLMSAVLKQYHHQNAYQQDRVLMQWSCETLLYDMQRSFNEVLNNLPHQFLAKLIRTVIFPFGLRYRQPDDHLSEKVAAIILSPSASRDRLTEGIYTAAENLAVHKKVHKYEPVRQLDTTLGKVIAAEKAEKKLHHLLKQSQLTSGLTKDLTKGQTIEYLLMNQQQKIKLAFDQGLINAEEYALLNSANQARDEVIRVDDFSQQLT